jgi:hypothetical protein
MAMFQGGGEERGSMDMRWDVTDRSCDCTCARLSRWVQKWV